MAAGFTAILLAGGGTVIVDEAKNPYTDKGDRLEIAKSSVIEAAGEVKASLNKDKPEVSLTKWGGEATLKVSYNGLASTTKGSRAFLTDRMEWKEAKKEMHAYPLAATSTMEDGGFEIEVILNEKPDTNVFDFTIENARNLDFFYQPELTAEDIAEGSFRPDNVVGSYAVYHKFKANHQVGLTNYATGKAFHIYRPKAIDANGAETWAELLYVDGVLSVTVPQKFLDDAVYPVRVDPTFGYTTLGASTAVTIIANSSSDTSAMFGEPYVLSEDATLESISIGLNSTVSDQTTDLYLALFDENGVADNSHDKVVAIEALDQVISVTAAFYTFNAASEAIVADTYIIAGLGNGEDVSTTVSLRHDTGASSHNFYFETTLGAGGYNTRKAEDPWTETEGASTNIRSIYATYTVASRSVTTSDFSFCRTMTATAGGGSGGIATTSVGQFPLIATSTISTLAATSSSGNVQNLESTRNTPLDIVFVDESSCSFGGSATAIPHYFEKYASTTGAFTVHLGTTNISSTTGKVLAMYYGNATQTTNLNSPGQTYATTSPSVPSVIYDLSVPGFATTTIPDFTDSTYNGYHARSNKMNNADLVDGMEDGGLDFDGTDDFLNATGIDNGPSDFGSSLFTVSAWIKTTDVGRIIDGDGAADYYFLEATTTGVAHFAFVTSAPTVVMDISAGNVDDGDWHMITGVRTGNRTGNLYIDGAIAATDTDDSGNFTGVDTERDLYIGKDGSGNIDFLDGIIDEVRLYRTGLHAMDVLTIYNNTKSSTVFWTFGSEQTPAAGASTPNAPTTLLQGILQIIGRLILP